MNDIYVNQLTKVYKIYEKEAGLRSSLKNLVNRKYFDKTAVSGIDFKIEEGELVGFLGANGSGKTTTLKMLSGILHPTTGTVAVCGHTPWKANNEFRKKISIIMGQKSQLWWDLPAIESFNLNKIIYQLDDKDFNRNLDELTELLDVKHLLKIQMRTLSLGEKMKMELIGAILHQPKVLFCDEPTIGLDIISQKKIRAFIKYYNQKNNNTIIFTSHHMNDIEDLCERVIFLEKGKIIYDGKLDDIKNRFSTYRVFKIKFNLEMNKQIFEKFGQLKVNSPYEIELKVPKENTKDVSQYILQNYEVEDITIGEMPIEDIVYQVLTSKEEIG